MKVRMIALVTVVSSLLMFTACMNLRPSQSTATRFYLLASKIEPMHSAVPPERLARLSLGVGPVTIPDYLNRPQLVSRLNGSELRVNEFHQWAEPLKTTIARVVEENLTGLTGARHIHAYPMKRSAVIDYQISLDIFRFEADPDGSVTLKSVWRMVNADNDRWRMERRSTIVQPSGGSRASDVVDAMSLALATLSQEMASALAEATQQ